MANGNEALKFLEKESTFNETSKTWTVSQKSFMDWMKSQGITEETYKSVNEAQQELINGVYRFSNGKLVDQVQATKKSGGDAGKESVKVSVTIPKGSIVMETHASKTYPVPGKSERVTKTCVTTLDIRQQRLLDKDLCSSCEDEMRKLLGL